LPEARELLIVAGFVGTALLGRDPSFAESRATRIRIMMSAPMTKTTVKAPKATNAAKRLFAELAAARAELGGIPEMDGGTTGNADAATGGAAGVVGIRPAAGVIGGKGREWPGFATERGMTDVAFRSMMTVP
jgi:hypothetical protein